MTTIRPLTRVLFALFVSALWTMATLAVVDAAGAPTAAKIRLLPSDAKGRQVSGPGYYQIRARPGATLHLFASVANNGGSAGSVRLVPVDAESGVYGGVSYNLPQHSRAAVGSWLHIPRSRLTLKPHQDVVIPFTVHVPWDASPGQHVGGLTAFVPVNRQRGEQFGSLIVQLRVIDAVVVTVPGHLYPKLKITTVGTTYEPSGLYVFVHIRNDGTLLTKGQFRVSVRKLGSTVPFLRRSLSVDVTVPHTSAAYPIAWPGHVTYGRYVASAHLSWDRGMSSWQGSFTLGTPPKPPVRPPVRVKPSGHSLGAPGHSSALGLVLGAVAAFGLLNVSALVFIRRTRILSRRRMSGELR